MGRPLLVELGATFQVEYQVLPSGASEPRLFGRVTRLDAKVEDSAERAPPRAALTLDGSPLVVGSLVDSPGTHHVAGEVTDCAGHTTHVEWRFRLDLEGPSLLWTEPADGSRVPDGRLFRGASQTDLLRASVNGQQARVDGGTFVVDDFRWFEGKNRAEIELEDGAGHTTRHRIAFEVRSLGPTIKILEYGLPIAPGTVFHRPVRPELEYLGTEVTVAAFLNGEPFDSGTRIERSGRYRLEAVATDLFGREARDRIEFSIDLETDPPLRGGPDERADDGIERRR